MNTVGHEAFYWKGVKNMLKAVFSSLASLNLKFKNL